MIEISKELQQLYATDGISKMLKIYVIGTDTVLSNDEIVSESFILTEILSDKEQITYGLCNSSKIEFTTIGDNYITEGSILKITILIGSDITELPLGTYIVDSVEKQTNKNLKNIIAYDRLYNIDNTDMLYFYEKTIFPLTLKQLRDNFFNYVGINCDDITLLNDSLTVNEYNDFRKLSAREFLTQICELNAVFGKMSRYDTFKFLDIVKSNHNNMVEDISSMSNMFIFANDTSFSITLPPIAINGENATGTIDWGDGTVENYDSQLQWDTLTPISHTYNQGGNYTVIIKTNKFMSITNGFCASNQYIREAHISEGIKTISAGAFYGASNLELVYLPSTAKVDTQSFVNCNSLSTVTFGSLSQSSIVDLTENNTMAFYNCPKLKNISYYTDNIALISTSVSNYFQKSENEYIPVNYLYAQTKNNLLEFTEYPIRTVKTKGFITKKINRIKVIESGGAVLYNIGLGNDEPNCYNIKGNFLLINRTSNDETLQKTINSLYDKMNALYYTPCEVTAKGLPYLETGDLLTITKDNQTFSTYILSRTLKGTIALLDNFSANGVDTLREIYSAEESLSQDVHNNYQNNRLNYITSKNDERIILPTERTRCVNQNFGNTEDLSNFEYMAIVTATIERGGYIQFEYRVDGETLDTKPIQSVFSPTINTYSLENSSNVTYQQIVLYLPQTNSAIGTHTLEVDVISNATGYIDRNNWVSCLKGQNLSTTDTAVVSITIIDLPDKLKYSKNQQLDLTGLVVCANYLGGGKKILTSNEYTVTFDTTSVGTQPVLITYNENSTLTATFNIEVFGNEYLKIAENLKNAKFCERSTSQQIYTTVYWVHEVNNKEIETSLSTSELQSWECDTLEPYYYTDEDRQYVGYYQILPNSKFGQHDMKITYKSPDTGNILEVWYTIYYLEEKVFNLPFENESYDWYPFRNPFAFYSLGSSKLLYECKDKNGNLVTAELEVDTSITEMAFTFKNKPQNAQYSFGENQIVEVYYISNALKEYFKTIRVNVRPYYDSRNQECNYNGNMTSIKKYYYKDLTPLRLKIDLTKKSYTGNITIKSYNSQEDADLYYNASISAVGYKQNNTLYFYNSQKQIENIFEQKNQVKEHTSINITDIGGENKNVYTTFPNDSYKFNGYTMGFAYWGDGTFSQVILTNNFNNRNSKYANTLGLITDTQLQELKLRNGYILNNGSKQLNYSNDALFECTHEYSSKDIYTVETTCSYPCICENNQFYSHQGVISGSQYPFGIDAYNIMINATTSTELWKSSNDNDWIAYFLRIPTTNNTLDCIVEFDFGETSLFNYQKDNSGNIQNSGFEGMFKFGTSGFNNTIFEKLSNLQVVSIPKISRIEKYSSSSLFIPCNRCNITTLNYCGPTSDIAELSDRDKATMLGGLMKGQNLRTSERIYSITTIDCDDDSIDIENLK